MIVLYIIGWLLLGFLAHYLSYLRRVVTGLPTNFKKYINYDDYKIKHLPYDMVDGKYVSIGYRSCPNHNDITGVMVICLGPISLTIWIASIILVIVIPIIAIIFINFLYILNHKIFKNELKSISIKNTINKDLD